ncbi:MAG: ATP-binding protein [Coleofasciculus sp. A1-SPW-01]|uniref:ATP-binding protein n=1 Tax=Coleofasciculus sp. A1-SPW-01 TaxID=3070819 RepID=UPI0032FEAF78
MSLVLQVLTINDELKDFELLFQLWQQVNQTDLEVVFDFSGCSFLRQNAVAFLGGLARLIESQGRKVSFKWDTLDNRIRINLQQNGFMHIFGEGVKPWEGNSIPYREDRELDKTGLGDYLSEQWLGRGWVHIDQLLKNHIVSTVWEIYANAFEHGQTNIGVFSCGQHYPTLGELKLTVVDFGVGIPRNVRDFLNQTDLSADETLKWAFEPGTTTKHGIARGIGLDSLKQFVRVNEGKLEIFSHNGYVIIDKTQETYQSSQTFFEGTLVNITLKCDESYYSLDSLNSEPSEEALF